MGLGLGLGLGLEQGGDVLDVLLGDGVEVDDTLLVVLAPGGLGLGVRVRVEVVVRLSW